MSYVTQDFDCPASRSLARRGAQHLKAGDPPVAVFAFDAKLRKNIHPLNIGASDISKEMSLSYDSSAPRR